MLIGRHADWRELAFQRVSPWTAPRWPDPEYSQHLHLEIRVTDVAAAERAVLALGARRLEA
jgi:Glyoxalase-like domain